MFKKILLSLCISVIIFSCSASAIEYSEITVDIYEDQYTSRQITIENIFGETLNFTITSDIPISFSENQFTLLENETKILTVYFFGTESMTGTINISYANSTDTIPVTINILEETVTNQNISLFPSIPYSGEQLVISLSTPADKSGFLLVNNKITPVSIHNGFTIVLLNQTDYGEAKLWLYGEGFVSAFNVECGIQGDAIIYTEETATIDDLHEVTLRVGDKKISGAILNVQDPDGAQYTYQTDKDGNIYPLLDKIGGWIIRSEFREKQTVKKITVSHRNMDVNINKESINLGDTVIITTDEEEADIVIKREGISQFQKTINTGVLEYSPTLSGSYTVEAESGDGRGVTSFKVNMQTSIRLLDKNNMQTSIIRQGQEYIIQVVDEKNQPIALYQSITAEKQYQTAQSIQSGNIYSGSMVTIPLNNGVGFWEPNIHGTYTLSVETNGDYIGSNLNINIEKNVVFEEDQTLLYVVIAIVVVMTLLFIFGILYKRGLVSIPNLPKRKKIPDRLL